jgi:hypothetical protein
MSRDVIEISRRRRLGSAAAATALRLMPTALHAEGTSGGLRPLSRPPQIVDLKRRPLAVRWPDKEPVSDTSQGV